MRLDHLTVIGETVKVCKSELPQTMLLPDCSLLLSRATLSQSLWGPPL